MPTSPRPGSASRPRATGERRNVRGLATRQLILAAAERLFAERGIEAVPLRDVGIAAGQRNHAVVQYHFGDRAELIREIMEFRGAETEARRAQIVADLTLGSTPPGVADVVAAFVDPLATHLEEDNHYLAFLSRYITEEGGYEGLGGGTVQAGVSVVTLQALLGRLLPDIPEEIRTERWWITLTSAVHTLARYHSALRKRGRLPGQRDALLNDLVAYLSAGLVAPVAEDDARATPD